MSQDTARISPTVKFTAQPTFKLTPTPTFHVTPKPAPQLSTVKAAQHFLKTHRTRFTTTGSNLALLCQAFCLTQPSFRADHNIVLA